MGLISAAVEAVGGTLADQWRDFFVAPTFDEQTVIAPGIVQAGNRGRASNRSLSSNVIADGSRVVVPENTAVIVTDGGGIASVSTQPGYFDFVNDGQPSIFSGDGVRETLIRQSWQRFKYGGQPAQQQLIYYVNLREIRSLQFGTPGALPYKDFSLVPQNSSQAPVLRVRARGQYSVRVVDPIRFFRTFLPANTKHYSLADEAASSQLRHEFITALQAAIQQLSRTTDIASLAVHGPELAATMTNQTGPTGSWLERFGLEITAAAIGAIEYDDASRKLMDKYNKGLMLSGNVGNAYTQTTIADAATTMAENGAGGGGMTGLAIGLGAISGSIGGLTRSTQPTSSEAPATSDPVVVLGQLKRMLDEGLISPAQYAAKQEEILGRM